MARFGARGVPADMAHKKLTLPTKPCAACHRPFAWRKKWARDWENVKFCSDRCRAAGVSDTGQAVKALLTRRHEENK